jgi:hypothetical protein
MCDVMTESGEKIMEFPEAVVKVLWHHWQLTKRCCITSGSCMMTGNCRKDAVSPLGAVSLLHKSSIDTRNSR